MATLENCHTCYPVSAPECAESYIISGLTPADELVAIATDRFGRTSRVDNETPVNDDGELTLVFPDGMTAWHAPKLSIRLYYLSDYENNRQLCAPLTMTICDVEYTCINLSFHQHSEELASVALICQCTNNDCPATCGTVASVDDLPDPPEGCDFILVYDDIAPRYLAALYEWHEGTGWHYHVKFETFLESNGTFLGFLVEQLDDWQVIVNGVSYTGNPVITFDNPVYYIEVEFVSPEGCRYTIEPFGEVPCTWYWDGFDISAGFLLNPQGTGNVTCLNNLDIQTLQSTYPYLSIFYTNVQGFGLPLFIYAPESVVQGWEIDNTPITWLPTSPACAEQEFRCYQFTLDIDLVTYPGAILHSIQPAGFMGPAAPLSVNSLLDEGGLETALNEYLSSVFGGVVTTDASYNGTTYTIRVYNVPYYGAATGVTLNFMTVERDAFDYVDMNKTDITCP